MMVIREKTISQCVHVYCMLLVMHMYMYMHVYFRLL